MGNDITVKIGDYKLNARVSVLIECNGKYLIDNIKGNSFYNLPGGRIQIGETMKKQQAKACCFSFLCVLGKENY
jgi:hypothetical protein